MVTIQAPGIEINEIDLSFYDMPGRKEETTNVYVTGFAAKGLNYIPYKFTSNNTAQDIVNTFGVPANEAERYFYNACVEVISKKKAVLYASRLPYCNTAMSTIVGAEYAVSSIGCISGDYEYNVGFISGSVASEDEITTYDEETGTSSSMAIHIAAKMPNKKSFFNTDFQVLNDASSADLSTVITEAGSNPLSGLFALATEKVDDEVSIQSFDAKLLNGWENINGSPLEYLSDVAFEFKLDTPVVFDSLSSIYNSLKAQEEQLADELDKLNEQLAEVTEQHDALEAEIDAMQRSDCGGVFTNVELSTSCEWDSELSVWSFKPIDGTEHEYWIKYIPETSISGGTWQLFVDDDVEPKSTIDGANGTEKELAFVDGGGVFIWTDEDCTTPEYDAKIAEGDALVIKIAEINSSITKKDKELSDKQAELEQFDGDSEFAKFIQYLKAGNWAMTPCYYRHKYGGPFCDKYSEIYTEDKTIKTAAKLEFDGVKKYALDKVDEYRTGQRKPAMNKFVIFDKTQAQYDEVPADQFHKGSNQQLVGIVPIVTTAANALYYQKMIDVEEDDIKQLTNYEAVGNIRTTSDDDVVKDAIKWKSKDDPELSSDHVENAFIYAENVRNTETGVIEPMIYNNLLVTGTNSQYFQADDKQATSMSKTAASMFPQIGKNDSGMFDREYMKHIGVVVFKGYLDPEEGNRVNFKPVESFAGTLKPGVLNSVTGKSMFIDEVINTNSQYIEFYSNCFSGDDNNFYTWDNDVQNEDRKTQELSADPKQSLVMRAVNPMTSRDYVLDGDPETEIKAETYDKATYDRKSMKDVEDPTNKGTYSRPGQVNGVIWDDVDILVANRIDAPVFGFKKADCLKIINVTESISKALDKCFEKMKDVNARQVDIMLDAGVSNIAQYYTTCNCQTGIFMMDQTDPDRGFYSILDYRPEVTRFNGKMFKHAYRVALEYNPVSPTAVKNWKLEDVAHTKKWQMILRKLDNFCKNMRKDCMFIADGLRPLCLKGNAKIVRPSNFTATIANAIAPRVKYMAGAVDTSYGAGYCDWVMKEDEFTGLNFWLPPSIKAVGVYIDTTNNWRYWDAPAGVNRGRLDVKDIAFSPSVYEAASFYTKSWNYCTFYEDEGNVLEGQRTLQSRPTAFDRVNVRRLFLYLERKVFLAGKYFLYQGNTAYTRQRLIDAITPYFEDAKTNGGCYDYRIICDETNNTEDTIDRNELHIKIGIKPVKTIEFIDVAFRCLRTGGSWTEAGF